jgi:hypothetical protein
MKSNKISVLQPVHILHLFLYAPTSVDVNRKGTPVFGRTRLMKAMFLFEKEYQKDFEDNKNQLDFNFEAYDYGPFSKDVLEALDFLISIDCIQTDNISEYETSRDDIDLDEKMLVEEAAINTICEINPFYSQKFDLTKQGIDVIQDTTNFFSWEKLSDNQKRILISLKTKIVNTSLREILLYVYTKYPKYAQKSKILSSLMINYD